MFCFQAAFTSSRNATLADLLQCVWQISDCAQLRDDVVNQFYYIQGDGGFGG
jgi:hypothetical protein